MHHPDKPERKSPGGPGPGLCRGCSHARFQRSAKGSEFWRCGRAENDTRWPRYPNLPVVHCEGFEEGTPEGPREG